MASTILGRNNVNILGGGSSPILFAHGFGCNQTMWGRVAPAFADTHRVVLFDYVGAGGSDHSAYDRRRYSSLDGYVDDVLEVCDALDLRDVVFVAHSVSGMIGILASLREPARFSRIVLIGGTPCFLNHPPDYHGGFEPEDVAGLLDLMEKNYIGWASYLAPVCMANLERPELTQELGGILSSTDPQIARQFAEVTFSIDCRSILPSVKVPSLILQCSDDAIAPVVVGEYLHRVLPRSTYRLMKATGHCPQVSQPDETIRLLRDYLGAPVAQLD